MSVKKLFVILIMAALVIGSAVSTRAVSATGEPEPTILVKKSASTSYDRTWEWNIAKKGSETSLTLTPGQVYYVNYTVDLSTAPVDSNWMVTGFIGAQNLLGYDVHVAGISDMISPNIPAVVECPFDFPRSLPAGWAMPICSYSQALPNGVARTNTATVTLTNGAQFTGSAPVTFGPPTTEQDECVTVTDTRFGSLGQVCSDTSAKSFSYTLAVGPYQTCGAYGFNNTASFVTSDTGATGTSTWGLNVNVPCAGGCTLTPGYWKTHSRYGPAPYDSTWLQVGEDTAFFLSGKSYYNALWTPPAGNAYYILAHAYIAAKLNFLNEAASTAAVDAAFTEATTLFQTYTPAQIGAMRPNSTVRARIISLATLLDNYNNGLVGPGHCTE